METIYVLLLKASLALLLASTPGTPVAVKQDAISQAITTVQQAQTYLAQQTQTTIAESQTQPLMGGTGGYIEPVSTPAQIPTPTPIPVPSCHLTITSAIKEGAELPSVSVSWTSENVSLPGQLYAGGHKPTSLVASIGASGTRDGWQGWLKSFKAVFGQTECSANIPD